MFFIMENNVFLNPINVCFFRTQTIMFGADKVSELVEKFLFVFICN